MQFASFNDNCKKFHVDSSKFFPNLDLASNTSLRYSDKNTRNSGSLVEEANSFDFKYVPEAELRAVLKRVRRANQKKRDKEQWENFLVSKKENNIRNINESCDECSSRNFHTCEDCGLLDRESNRTISVDEEDSFKEENIQVSDDLNCKSVHELRNTGIDDHTFHTYQLGPGLTKRLQDLLSTVSKMTSLLVNPSLNMQYEDEDVERAIKRSLEFDAMFARNHLYEIQRLLKDIKQFASGKTFNTADLESKISAALKCLTQALQVYTKHVIKGSRVKYQQVVPIFQSVSSIHGLLEQLTGQRLFPLRQEIEVACSYMKQLLLEMSTTETKSMSISTVSHKHARARPVRHKPSADLSMYNRKHKDWRIKSATLARHRFGLPTNKKHHGKGLNEGESASKTDGCEGKNKNLPANKDTTHSHPKASESYDQLREPTNTKEIPYRNATRAVPEEKVSTMMEVITREGMDEEDLCLDLDDGTFQVLNLLNGGHASLQDDHKADVQKSPLKSATVDRQSNHDSITRLSSARSTTKDPNNDSQIASQSNVQLLCIKESTAKCVKHTGQSTENTETTDVPPILGERKLEEDQFTKLTIEEDTKAEALEYHQQVLEYQKSSSLYKDGKALGIVDRLANQILTEMVMDFQNEEINEVVQALYKLEFE